jgi:uncharacterized protein YoaH (UPF0181 family)
VSGTIGAKIVSASTDPQGNFSLSLGAHTGPVMLQMSGGTYADEASGNSMSMLSGDVMTAVLPTMAAGATVSGIQMTPLTSMAQTMAQHLAGGMTLAAMSQLAASQGMSSSAAMHWRAWHLRQRRSDCERGFARADRNSAATRLRCRRLELKKTESGGVATRQFRSAAD